MTAVFICLDENDCVVNAISADTEEEAQAYCTANSIKYIKHKNGMPFMQGWFWNGEKFEER